MKSAPFQYELPLTETELEGILSSPNYDGRILAGGQSLMQLMNMRKVKPKKLVDINKIDSFHYIVVEEDYIAIGPLVRHQELCKSEIIAKWCPILVKAVGMIGHRAIRNRGTAIGSVSQADPTAEIPTVMTALCGEVVVRDSRLKEDFIYDAASFLQYKSQNKIQNYQYVREIRIPKRVIGEGQSFKEFSERKNDPAIASVAISIKLNVLGEIIAVGGAISGLNSTPVYFRDEKSILIGKKGNDLCFEEASQKIIKEKFQEEKSEYSNFYLGRLVASLLLKALQEAYQHAMATFREEESHGTNQGHCN